MRQLFTHALPDMKAWVQIRESADVFAPLIQHIFHIEHMPMDEIQSWGPATNAVFRVGERMIKIYAPRETGMDLDSDDFSTEVYGLQWAQSHQVTVPAILASGCINDVYAFRYLITEYVGGIRLAEAEDDYSESDKTAIGTRLRQELDRLNQPSPSFNTLCWLEQSWDKDGWLEFPPVFQQERQAYLRNGAAQPTVFVHGDINPCNLVVDDTLDMALLDFADALCAPIAYEWIAVICYAFAFDPAYLKGFFQTESESDIVDLCLDGLLMHPAGANMIQCNLGKPMDFADLATLRCRIRDVLRNGQHADGAAYVETLHEEMTN